MLHIEWERKEKAILKKCTSKYNLHNTIKVNDSVGIETRIFYRYLVEVLAEN